METNVVINKNCIDGLKDIDSNSIDLIITDPPYEVNYNNKSKELSKMGKAREKQVIRDESFIDIIPDYDLLSKEMFRVLKDNTHLYLFCGTKQINKWVDSLKKVGFKNYQILTWKKESPTMDMTMGHYFLQNTEFVIFFHKGWKKLNTYKINREKLRTCLEFDASKDTSHHSCAKPINLLNFLVKLSSNKGDLCLDLFGGSGNHLIAFKNNKRKYIGFELSENYCNNIKKRLASENSIGDWFD